MFLILLLVSLVLALCTSLLAVGIFERPAIRILGKIIGDDIADAWWRYLQFAVIVAGVSGGVEVWELRKYIPNASVGGSPQPMNLMSWILEIYNTIINTLQSISTILAFFFVLGLIALVVLRISQARQNR